MSSLTNAAYTAQTLTCGDRLPSFELPALDGSLWDSSELKGHPALVVFFRFASCPFCQLRLHQLTRIAGSLPENFRIVAIFDSDADNLRQYAGKHHAPFPVLADENAVLHRRVGVRYSWSGVLRGMLWRLPTLLYSMLVLRNLPTRINGQLNGMPMNFLIDEHGVIEVAYYGNDEGDHLAIDAIRAFAESHQPKV